MLSLIIIVLSALGFAYLAAQNTASATFYLLGYAWTLPIYMIALGALLAGFFISWVIGSISSIGTWSAIHGKDSKISETEQTVTQLQSKIRELELENAKLQGRNEVTQKEVVVEKPVVENRKHSFFDRFRGTPAY